ncbi:MAG: hypothetical protein ACI9V1_002261 [Spirosomataceae bacterium]|jgi:hypothetical protein
MVWNIMVFLAGIIVLIFAIYYFIVGLVKKDKKMLSRAGLFFVAMWVIQILLIAVNLYTEY